MTKLLLFLLFSTAAQAQLTIQSPQDYGICDSEGSEYAYFNLTVMDMPILDGSGLNLSQYDVTYFVTQADAQQNVNPIVNSYAYQNISSPQTIYARVQSTSNQDYGITDFNIIVNNTPTIGTVAPLIVFDEELPYDDFQAVVSLSAHLEPLLQNLPNQNYNLSFHTSAEDAMYGENQITDSDSFAVQDETTVYYRLSSTDDMCYTAAPFDIVVLPADYQTPVPTGETLYGYLINETLADIPLEGENIQWYATDGSGSFPEGETPLPLDTVLTNNTTYYASQTVYGIESEQRLAVEVYSVIMGLGNTAFTGLQYYPNPVKNVLSIANSNEIESITIANSLGQQIDSVVVKSSFVEADLSYLSAGVYFVKITAGSQQKTLKIIKE